MGSAAPSLRWLSLLAAAAAACSPQPVKLRRLDDREVEARRRQSALSSASPSARTLSVLRRLGFEDDAALGAVEPRLGMLPRWEARLAGAELLYRDAKAAEGASAPEAEALYLSAALSALEGLRALPLSAASVFDDGHKLLAELHSGALRRFFSIASEREHPSRWRELRTRDGVLAAAWRQGADSWDPSFFDAFLPAETIEIEGLRARHTRGGIGVPLVAIRHNGPPARATEKLFPPEGRVYPATFAALPAAGGLELALLDPRRCETIRVEESPVPVAADFTAPYAQLMVEAELHALGDTGFFSADEAEFHRGLFLLEPYDRARIPVVMVHGLWSNPLVWRNLTNDLWGDAELRRRCQVWHYMYPTGTPILNSARELRRSLLEVRRELDPEGDDPAMENFVLVGHSMGGLLTRLMVTRSGDRIWNARFKKPLEELELSDEDRQHARSTYFFEPLPFIRRVVFLATPHRGSTEADSFIAWFGKRVMTVPSRVRGFAERLNHANPEVSRSWTDQPTSVDVLSPSHVVIRALAELPVEAPFHSVIGDRTWAPGLGRTDGVVTYESAHLDGAESELVVVPSEHDVQTHPETILEVQRILREHARRSEGPPAPPRPAGAGSDG
jgi:pimeloyl-ACP methyl ester carboxylesterase